MKKVYLNFLLWMPLVSLLLLTACEEEEEAIPNEPPKIAFSVNEADFQPVDLNEVSPPAITGTVQSDAGLRQVTIELLRGSEVEVLQNVSTFDEISSFIYVFNITPEYSEEVTGLRVTGVDVQDRVLERTLNISVIEEIPDLVFSPRDGMPGTQVVLTGFEFVAENIESITIGDIEVEEYTVAEAGTHITLTVPEGAQSGVITVTQVEGNPIVSSQEFKVNVEPKVIVVHSDVVVNAQGVRNDEGKVTAFSAKGETFTLQEGTDEATSAMIDFIAADSGGDEGLDLFSPSHESWLPGNYFEDSDDLAVVWPVLNQTKMVHLEGEGEEFFENITPAELAALSIGSEFETRIEIQPNEDGTPNVPQVILFETAEGEKGLLLYKGHNPNAEEGSKADIFTFDIKVLE